MQHRMTNENGLQVIKLGGSLMDLADLGDRLLRWYGLQGWQYKLLIVGGGRMVDEVRRLCGLWNVSETTAHRCALEAMSLNTTIIAESLRRQSQHPVDVITHLEWPAIQRLTFIDPSAALYEIPDCRREGLEHRWSVTSDSIAAWLSRRLGASELALLKSRLPVHAGHREIVDDAFDHYSNAIRRIRLVNLRDDDFAEADYTHTRS
jgi:aspartokinase-like uncharacterized kinase